MIVRVAVGPARSARSNGEATHLCLSQFSILEEYLVNLGLFMPYPEQRVRLENISSVQGNIILCEKLKTNLCGKLRNNNGCKIVALSHAFATKY